MKSFMDENLRFTYTFKFSNDLMKTFGVTVDKSSLQIVNEQKANFPEWTKLENFACDNCPLSKEENTYCPIAINLVDIIDFFSEYPSFEVADIVVETNNRTYFKRTSVQSGVSGLIGIIMPSSGCPITKKLRPLVKFHLPFASIEETEYRVFSMYLFSQMLRERNGKKPDWEMKGVAEMYKDIIQLNQNIAKRIADLEKRDTSINAVVVLNNFADSVSFTLDENDLSDFEEYFKDFLEE